MEMRLALILAFLCVASAQSRQYAFQCQNCTCPPSGQDVLLGQFATVSDCAFHCDLNPSVCNGFVLTPFGCHSRTECTLTVPKVYDEVYFLANAAPTENTGPNTTVQNSNSSNANNTANTITNTSTSKGLSAGAIAGIVVGSAVGGALFFFIILRYMGRRRSNSSSE